MFHVEHTMTQNIVKDALDNGLTLKQELFARAASSGMTLCDSERQAGYADGSKNTHASLGTRMIRQERIQARIHELIAQQQYERDAQSVWRNVLNVNENDHESGGSKWCAIVDRKLRVIEQIAKLGGWEPSKQTETKQLVLKGQIKDILPK